MLSVQKDPRYQRMPLKFYFYWQKSCDVRCVNEQKQGMVVGSMRVCCNLVVGLLQFMIRHFHENYQHFFKDYVISF